MKKTKLIEILKTFSKEEMKEFEKFIASTYFSCGRDLMPFYKVLKTYYPGFNEHKFTAKAILKKLHPELEYQKNKSENLIRVLSSDMLKIAEEFLIQEKFRQNKLQRQICLLETFRERGLNNFFIKTYKESDAEFSEPKSGVGINYLMDYYRLKIEKSKFEYLNNMIGVCNVDSQIILILIFIIECDSLNADAATRKSNFNIEKNDDLIEILFKNFDFHNFSSIIKNRTDVNKKYKEILELYLTIQSVRFNNFQFEDILELERKFYEVKKYLDSNSKYSFYADLSGKYSLDPKLNEERLYNLYGNLVKDNLYGPGKGNEIPYLVYRSIFQNFTGLNKMDEAEKFLKEYSEYLKPELKEAVVNDCLASLEFRKRDFGKALEYLSKINLNHFVLKYDVRNKLLRVYYHLEYYDEAFSLVESYKAFLKNNKSVPSYIYKNLNRLLAFYKRLLVARISNNQTELKNLKSELGEDGTWFTPWILDRVNELLEKKLPK